MTGYQIKSNIPFSQVAKIWRYLSYKDKDGKDQRFTLSHAGILAYFYELPEHYKSARDMERDLGMCHKKIKALRDELATPTIEMGVPLIAISDFVDRFNNPRKLIEIYPHDGEMGKYYEILYKQGDESKAYRESWKNRWNIQKKTMCGRTTHGGVGEPPTGVWANDPHKETNKKETNKKLLDDYQDVPEKPGVGVKTPPAPEPTQDLGNSSPSQSHQKKKNPPLTPIARDANMIPNHSVTRKNLRGDEYTISIDDIHHHAVKGKMEWSTEDIVSGWERFVEKQVIVTDPLGYICSIIKNAKEAKWKNQKSKGLKKKSSVKGWVGPSYQEYIKRQERRESQNSSGDPEEYSSILGGLA